MAPLNDTDLRRMLDVVPSQFQFASDASGRVGCGAIWPPYWLQFKWEEASYNFSTATGVTASH